MGNTALLRRGQCVGDFDADAQQAIERHAAARNDLAERLAVDQFHRQQQPAAVLLDRVDGDDPRVVEGGDRLGLAFEPFTRRRVRSEGGRKDLQRNPAVQPGVVGEEHLSHSAFANWPDDPVMPDGVARVHRGSAFYQPLLDSRRQGGSPSSDRNVAVSVPTDGGNAVGRRLNRTGFIGGLFPREDGAHGTPQ